MNPASSVLDPKSISIHSSKQKNATYWNFRKRFAIIRSRPYSGTRQDSKNTRHQSQIKSSRKSQGREILTLIFQENRLWTTVSCTAQRILISAVGARKLPQISGFVVNSRNSDFGDMCRIAVQSIQSQAVMNIFK